MTAGANDMPLIEPQGADNMPNRRKNLCHELILPLIWCHVIVSADQRRIGNLKALCCFYWHLHKSFLTCLAVWVQWSNNGTFSQCRCVLWPHGEDTCMKQERGFILFCYHIFGQLFILDHLHLESEVWKNKYCFLLLWISIICRWSPLWSLSCYLDMDRVPFAVLLTSITQHNTFKPGCWSVFFIPVFPFFCQ